MHTPWIGSTGGIILAQVHLACDIMFCREVLHFSALKRVKSSLRSSIGNKRLSALTLLHIHRDVDIDIPEMTDEFDRRHPRRMKLANILQDS